jgi:hypothetical protein
MGVFAMKTINPTVSEHTYQPRADGVVTKYWLVKCRMPLCADAPNGVYAKKHSALASAVQDRMRLVRQFGGGTLNKDEFRDAECALHRLKSADGPAKGATLSQAVDFYLENFKGLDSSPTVDDAVCDFLELKKRRLRPTSLEEYEYYLRRLKTKFAAFRLGQITPQLVTEIIDAAGSPIGCHRILHSFFSYWAGTSKKLRNPSPCLGSNPVDFYSLDVQDVTDRQVVILTFNEVRNALALAAMVGDLPYWVWCLFTGMRPIETFRFWTWEGYGWARVHLDAGVIKVPSEIAKTKRARQIVVRPNLKAWLEYFRATEVPMFPACHRLLFREVKRGALPDEKHAVKDLLRHTYISNRVQAFDRSLAMTAIESGNSERIIKDHYFHMITDLTQVESFWAIRPETLGLEIPPAKAPPAHEAPDVENKS